MLPEFLFAFCYLNWLFLCVGMDDTQINNAGVSKRRLEVYEDAEETMQVNYFSANRVTEELMPFLRASPHGARIVMISSQTALLEVSKVQTP